LYKVILEPSAQQDLKKLAKNIYARVIIVLGKLEADPRYRGAKKLKGFDHQWRARVGDYRVLYEIDDNKNVVHIYRIAHRKEVYR